MRRGTATETRRLGVASMLQGCRRESQGQTRDETRSAKCITGNRLHSGCPVCVDSPPSFVEAEKHPKMAKMKPDTKAVMRAGMINPAEYTLTQQNCGSQSEPAISNSKNLDFNFFNFFSTSLRLLFFNFSSLLFTFSSSSRLHTASQIQDYHAEKTLFSVFGSCAMPRQALVNPSPSI